MRGIAKTFFWWFEFEEETLSSHVPTNSRSKSRLWIPFKIVWICEFFKAT